MKSRFRLLCLLSFLALLGACSSSDDDESSGGGDFDNTDGGGSNQDGGGTGTAGSANKMGMLIVAESDDEDFGSVVGATATFSGYDESFEVPTTTTALFDELVGTCEISDGSDIDDDSPLPDVGPDDDDDLTFLDAGDTVSILSGGQSYLTLDKIEFGGAIFYGTENLVSGPMASDLTLTIPGGQFPAASSVPVESVETMVVNAPTAGSSVRFDTAFSWQPGNNDEAIVLITAEAGTVSVDCYTEDDGSFTFPTETQNALGTAFVASEFSLARMAVDLYYNSGEEAVLFVISSSIR